MLAGCSGATHVDSTSSPTPTPTPTQSRSASTSAPEPKPAPARAVPQKPIVGPSLSARAIPAPPVFPLGGGPREAPAIVSRATAHVAPSGPKILSVKTSPAIVHDGDTLLWNVRTTPDVIDVVAHVTAYAFRLQKQATGQYLLSFTIPHGVPFFFHGNYTLDLVARTAAGVETTAKVPVAFQ